MTIRIPQNTQNYLTVMLENKIQANRGESLFGNIEGYCQKYLKEIAPATASKDEEKIDEETPEEKAAKKTEQLKISLGKALKGEENIGGFGGGEPTPKSYSKGKGIKNPLEITFGETGAEGLLGGGIAYGIGSLPAFLGKLAGTKIAKDPSGKLSKKMAGPLGGFLSKLGGQIEDITGKSWFDAQIGNIGRSQMSLVAQGAGSPWTPFVMPGRSKSGTLQQFAQGEMAKQAKSKKSKTKP